MKDASGEMSPVVLTFLADSRTAEEKQRAKMKGQAMISHPLCSLGAAAV